MNDPYGDILLSSWFIVGRHLFSEAALQFCLGWNQNVARMVYIWSCSNFGRCYKWFFILPKVKDQPMWLVMPIEGTLVSVLPGLVGDTYKKFIARN